MFLRYLLKSLLLPPAINLLALLFAVLLLRRWRWLQNVVVFLSLASLAILSMPITAQWFAGRLEVYPPLSLKDIDARDYQAIVVLSAGRHRDAFEYGGDTVNELSLQRARYGAYLQRATGLPLLASGGIVIEGVTPEAELLAAALEREFSANVPWRETESRTTWENALGVKRIAQEQGLTKVLLVTHAWHMPRALYSFEQAGLRVTAAPTMFLSIRTRDPDFLDFVPTAGALRQSTLMLHELLGMFWYRFSA